MSSYPHIATRLGNRDVCASFRLGGDLTELAAALAVAASLTKLTSGIYFDPQDGTILDGDEVLGATKQTLELVNKDLQRERHRHK